MKAAQRELTHVFADVGWTFALSPHERLVDQTSHWKQLDGPIRLHGLLFNFVLKLTAVFVVQLELVHEQIEGVFSALLTGRALV